LVVCLLSQAFVVVLCFVHPLGFRCRCRAECKCSRAAALEFRPCGRPFVCRCSRGAAPDYLFSGAILRVNDTADGRAPSARLPLRPEKVGDVCQVAESSILYPGPFWSKSTVVKAMAGDGHWIMAIWVSLDDHAMTIHEAVLMAMSFQNCRINGHCRMTIGMMDGHCLRALMTITDHSFTCQVAIAWPWISG
jgi:hypothetical protein